MINSLDSLLSLKREVERRVYNEIDNLLNNLSRLNEEETVKLAERIASLHKEHKWNWYLLDLKDKLNQIQVNPNEHFEWIYDFQVKTLNDIKKEIDNIIEKQKMDIKV